MSCGPEPEPAKQISVTVKYSYTEDPVEGPYIVYKDNPYLLTADELFEKFPSNSYTYYESYTGDKSKDVEWDEKKDVDSLFAVKDDDYYAYEIKKPEDEQRWYFWDTKTNDWGKRNILLRCKGAPNMYVGDLAKYKVYTDSKKTNEVDIQDYEFSWKLYDKLYFVLKNTNKVYNPETYETEELTVAEINKRYPESDYYLVSYDPISGVELDWDREEIVPFELHPYKNERPDDGK